MWAWYALFTAILWGVTYTVSSLIVKQIDVKTSLFLQCGIQAIIAFIWVHFDGCLERDIQSSSIAQVWPLILIATIASFIACFCSISAVKYGGAEFAAMIEISYPLFVIVFSSMVKGKLDVSWNTIIGGIIIAIGTIFVIRSHV